VPVPVPVPDRCLEHAPELAVLLND